MLLGLLQTIVNGVAAGGVYLLFGLGLTIVFGVIGVINFAHGAFLMLAMYLSMFLVRWIGIDPYVTVLATAPALFCFGYVLQKTLINRVLTHPHLNQLLLTLGVLLVLQNFILWAVGPQPIVVDVPYLRHAIDLGPINLSLPRAISLLLALLIAFLLFLLLQRTRIGRSIRAAAVDRTGATLVGIDVGEAYALAFGIGAACVGACGALIVPFFSATPFVGESFLILGFVVVIVGGLGSMSGAVVAGLLVGIIDTFGQRYLPGSSGRMLLFALLILTLLVRPSGLFGRARL